MSNVYKLGVVQDKIKCFANQKQLILYFVFLSKHILIFYILKQNKIIILLQNFKNNIPYQIQTLQKEKNKSKTKKQNIFLVQAPSDGYKLNM